MDYFAKSIDYIIKQDLTIIGNISVQKWPQVALRNIVKRGKPGVGIDKHKISFFLYIFMHCCNVSNYYAYLYLYKNNNWHMKFIYKIDKK